jgi:hypothetical protein
VSAADYQAGLEDGRAGRDPDHAKTAGGATRLNDYERGYIDSGHEERGEKMTGPWPERGAPENGL